MIAKSQTTGFMRSNFNYQIQTNIYMDDGHPKFANKANI